MFFSTITQIRRIPLKRFVVKMNLKSYRVVLRKEIPSTDIKNSPGVLKCQDSMIIFTPQEQANEWQRTYSLKDLQSISLTTLGWWFTKKQIVLLKFSKENVSVEVFIQPLDHSSEFLISQIQECFDKYKKGTLPGIVGSFIDKVSEEGQKIVKEVGAIIQSSTKELSTALSQTNEFIRQATQAANILESFEINDEEKLKTANLEIKDIDEIVRRALGSDKIEAMINSLVAKGLISAEDNKYQEALDALKIAREAARNENMREYEEMVEKRIKEVEEAETSDYLDSYDPQFSERAAKYAQEARDIVADWEASKSDELNDEYN